MTKEVNITCCGAVSAETCTNATFGAVTTFLPLVNGGAAIRVFTQEDMLLVGGELILGKLLGFFLIFGGQKYEAFNFVKLLQ
jgi:hypothetical protein